MDSLPQKIVGMSNEEYQTKKGYLRRSYLHSVCKYGGEAQQWLDSGRSLFSGSAATTLGSKFDQMVTGEKGLCNGNDIESQLAVPPADVLASNGARSGGKFASRSGIKFALSAHIQKYGIKPSLFFTKPFEKAFKKLPDILIDKYGLDAERELNSILKQNLKNIK